MNIMRSLTRFAIPALAINVIGGGGTAANAAERPEAAPVAHWRNQKFGLMMHWGLYSVAGGVWKGKQIEGYNEQIKHRAKISWPDYLTLEPGFTAEKWDPDTIAQLAKDAGMRYVVITSKHHDGFNLWHTRLSDFNPVDSTPAKKDVLKMLSDACARKKMNFGVYYSLIDWHYPGAAPMSDSNSDPITPALENYTLGQLRELLTGYGPISEVWFDMSAPTPQQSKKIADLVHELQPDCMVSGRIWNGEDDFMVCGDNEVPDTWSEGAWESPVTMFHDTWGYRSWQQRDNLPGKIREKIRDLAMVTSRGGNYLLNIGPRGDGSIVEFDADVLKGIGKWMKANGEAIYTGEPEPHLKLEFGYATRRGGRLYLYVTAPASDEKLHVPGWIAQLPKAHVLTAGKPEPLLCKIDEGILTIKLPADLLDPNLTIVAVDFAGKQPCIPSDAVIVNEAPVTLASSSALAWHRMSGNDYYSLHSFVTAREWVVMPRKSGLWKVIAKRSAGGAHAGFVLSANGHEAQFILPDSANAQEQECLSLELKAGEMATLKLHDIGPGSELNDKGLELELAPVK